MATRISLPRSVPKRYISGYITAVITTSTPRYIPSMLHTSSQMTTSSLYNGLIRYAARTISMLATVAT